jgi:hypothetical protein
MPLESQSSAILEFCAKRTLLATPEQPGPRRIASKFTRRHQTRPLDTRLRKILTDNNLWPIEFPNEQGKLPTIAAIEADNGA